MHSLYDYEGIYTIYGVVLKEELCACNNVVLGGLRRLLFPPGRVVNPKFHNPSASSLTILPSLPPSLPSLPTTHPLPSFLHPHVLGFCLILVAGARMGIFMLIRFVYKVQA